MNFESKGIESVKEYYGKVLKSSRDLKTSACCTADSMPIHLREILSEIHPEVKDRFYGCGSPIPHALEGASVLDLGSGSGRDVFMLSKLVGPTGQVTGVDMTDEQLEVARKHIDYHTRKFGFPSSNVTFKQGYIEDLESLGVPTASVDLVTSNCVINLSPNKERVFKEIFRVLKPGGELYFSDVFATRRLPSHFREDPVLLGECLGGALYVEDFRRMMFDLGCSDFRVTAKSKIDLFSEPIKKAIGLTEFFSITVRAFKLNLEDRCEDFGQVAIYKGSIESSPNYFVLDDHHTFEKNRPMSVCGNTASMLQNSRYSRHFQVTGDTSTHYGLFNCAPTDQAIKPTGPGACC
ncbi:MAG: methyltransferase domain-containing protein [Bdellovibrionales bacterium]